MARPRKDMSQLRDILRLTKLCVLSFANLQFLLAQASKWRRRMKQEPSTEIIAVLIQPYHPEIECVVSTYKPSNRAHR
jgi:hypothetical protein